MRRILIGCLVVVAGCGTVEPCTEGESRCTGNTVEVCDANAEWAPLADCGALSRLARRSLVCAFVGSTDGGVAEGNTCIPEPPASE